MRSLLFGPRRLPHWWLRFTQANPAVPTIIAVGGLVSIVSLLAPTLGIADKPAHGQLIELLAVVTKSEVLVEQATGLRDAFHSLVPGEIREWVLGLFGNPALYILVPFLLFLEYLFPHDPAQPLVSKALLQDAIWFVMVAPMNILLLGAAYQFLGELYADHLAFLTIRAATAWPALVQAIVALLVSEFLVWLSHFASHKIHVLWLFHAVHHSQKQLNIFTEDRIHVMDRLFTRIFAFIPYYAFQVPSLYAVAIVGLYLGIHMRFVHANLKMNLGWLGWLLVSPQFHRVHHSADPEHADKNFGAALSIFDHLFGTAHKSRNIYPETGIADARFPTEDKVAVTQLPRNWLMQTIYPFAQLLGWVTRRRVEQPLGR